MVQSKDHTMAEVEQTVLLCREYVNVKIACLVSYALYSTDRVEV